MAGSWPKNAGIGHQVLGWFLTKNVRIVQNNDLQLQIGHPVNDDNHLFYKVQCHKSKIILSTNMRITLS